MGIRDEISQMVRGLCKQAQVWGHYAPVHDAKAEAAIGKATLKAPIAAVGGVLGGTMGAADGVTQNGVASLVGAGNAGDTWRQIGNGIRIGAKTGWNEAGRAYSDVATTGAQVAHDFGLMPTEKLNGIKFWNDGKLLESMNRAGIPMPSDFDMQYKYTDPRTGLMLPTGLPEYEEYDSFVNGARNGQLAGRIGLDIGAFAYGGRALGTALPAAAKAMGAGSKVVGGAMIAGRHAPWVGLLPTRFSDAAEDASYKKDVEAVNLLDKTIQELERGDPSTPEYADKYRRAAKVYEKYPIESFKRLKTPLINYVQ